MEHVAIVCLTRMGTNHMFILQKHEKNIVRLSPACALLMSSAENRFSASRTKRKIN